MTLSNTEDSSDGGAISPRTWVFSSPAVGDCHSPLTVAALTPVDGLLLCRVVLTRAATASMTDAATAAQRNPTPRARLGCSAGERDRSSIPTKSGPVRGS